MPRCDRQLPLYQRVAAVCLFAHLLAVMALAASPRLHQWVHPDADDDGHDCAVVVFVHGGSGDVLPGPVAVPALAGRVVTVALALPRAAAFVPSVFAAGGVFEHAPPAVG